MTYLYKKYANYQSLDFQKVHVGHIVTQMEDTFFMLIKPITRLAMQKIFFMKIVRRTLSAAANYLRFISLERWYGVMSSFLQQVTEDADAFLESGYDVLHNRHGM